MNIGRMKEDLREAVDDLRGRRFTDGHLMSALNRAVKSVGLFVANHQQERNYLPNPTGPVTVTTDGSARSFTVSAANFLKIWRVIRTDTDKDESTKLYRLTDEHLYTYGSGYDGYGRVLYAISIIDDDNIKVYFPVIHKSGIVLSIDYVSKIKNLGSGPDNDVADSDGYPGLPDVMHDLVILYAARRLLSSDDANYAGVREQYIEMRAEVQRLMYSPEGDEPNETYDPEEDLQIY